MVGRMNQISPQQLFKSQVSSPSPQICFTFCLETVLSPCCGRLGRQRGPHCRALSCPCSVLLLFQWLLLLSSFPAGMPVVHTMPRSASRLPESTSSFVFAPVFYHLGVNNRKLMKTGLFFSYLSTLCITVTSVFGGHCRTVTLSEIHIPSRYVCQSIFFLL